MEASNQATDLSSLDSLIPDKMNTTFISKTLKIRRATVSGWVTSGQLPATREGKQTMIAKADLIAFLKKRYDK